MILADKITEERKKKGWSQEELADKIGVSRQAVSKWESAGSVPDLQRVIQLAELFQVSTDYLLKDQLEHREASVFSTDPEDEVQHVRRVSMEEANSFLDWKKNHAHIIANATFLCIISPALLILLTGFARNDVFRMTEGVSAVIGFIFLFGCIATAVFFFITSGIRNKQMEYLEKEAFETEYGVSGMVTERRQGYEPVFIKRIAAGVVLCILSVVPVVIAGIVTAPDYICTCLVSLLLILIAIGVNMIICASIVKGSYDTLLQEGEFSKKEKQVKRKMERLSSVYWCIATAIYLGWSFLTKRWNITWVIWPVAGIFFAAVSGIARMIIGETD